MASAYPRATGASPRRTVSRVWRRIEARAHRLGFFAELPDPVARLGELPFENAVRGREVRALEPDIAERRLQALPLLIGRRGGADALVEFLTHGGQRLGVRGVEVKRQARLGADAVERHLQIDFRTSGRLQIFGPFLQLLLELVTCGVPGAGHRRLRGGGLLQLRLG